MSFYGYYLLEQLKPKRIGWYGSVKEGRVILDGRALVGIVFGFKRGRKPKPPKTDLDAGFQKIYVDGVKVLRKTYR